MTDTKNRGASPEAIQHHYDVGNDFYAAWLDERMIYSAAIWPDDPAIPCTLEEAQLAKLDWHVAALNLQPGARLLDVGCGWGGMMQRTLNTRHLATAAGLTLSNEQAAWIAEKVGERAITAHIVPWQDFSSEMPFDGIVSIGAFEHFARPEMTRDEKIRCYSDFFAFCARNLVEGGSLALQTIVWLNIRPEQEQKAIPLDIFPESKLPHLGEITAAAEPFFHLMEMHDRPRDYARTLRHWSERIRQKRPELEALYGAETVKLYLNRWAMFTIGFERGLIGLCRFRFVKRAARNLLDERPL